MRRTPAALALTAALALVVPAGAACSQPVERPAPTSTTRVLAISVDGLNTDAISELGAEGAPTFHRLLDEGAGTLNARTEHEQTVTLPNHTGMMTGRRVDAARGGHGVTWDDDRTSMTVQKAAGHPVSSVFTVAHAAGGATALFTTKEKFGLYERSWRAGIDRYEVDEDQAQLVKDVRADLVSADRTFTFLHVSLPDRFGHQYGGMSPQYLAAVQRTDAQLGRLLKTIRKDAGLRQDLVVVLTADHGFAPGLLDHSGRTTLANYRIPFLVWGAGVTQGDLYDLNPAYKDPGTKRPTYAAKRQPVRNADVADLAAGLLGLEAVPGSEMDADQSLVVTAEPTR
ncbi:alkaline phosphatase family protein [Nocardioides sp. CN2-186]|uniref:alkaline phosphatase family protein n=1 Tax=Nocardioides tweenelious TaxID=3156607 RepID=UPI0032B5F8CA